MEEENKNLKNDNLQCKECGERQFTLRGGFYYCDECNTKLEEVRAIEVDNTHEFTDSKNVKKQKIHANKLDKPALTSWECYNYILRGMVEELLSLGAKEELKLMALQVWAAYLRHLEVAFFNKKHAELPKLGIRFLKHDACTLYNHSEKKRAQRKRKRTDEASVASASASSMREWRKAKRQLDESTYSLQSTLDSTNTSGTSSTGTTRHAIQLKFSSKARRHLKKTMPVRHLEKHAKDPEGLLQCHNLRPKVTSLNRSEHEVSTVNMKLLYCLLGIALNLVQDDIQLCDLSRFIDEQHLSAKNVAQYFPADLPDSKKMLQRIEFYNYADKYSDRALRDHITLLAKNLNIYEFKPPDVLKLALRYTTDLNLPPEICTFVERLINILPPQFKTRVPYAYPAYESRAMAYVIFVLKLLFGLDGHKEKLISKSAAEVNEKIKEFTADGCSSQQLLFNWQEWLEYIEMRKIIVSQYNATFSKQFKQCQSTAQLLEELSVQEGQMAEQAAQSNEPVNPKISNLHSIFEKFLASYQESTAAETNAESIAFSASFTPAHTYFKRLLLHCSSTENMPVTIPDFMRTDHTQRTVMPYLQPKPLRVFFEAHSWQLKVQTLACTEQRKFVGTFRVPNDYVPRPKFNVMLADFNISEEMWLKSSVEDVPTDELEFKTELDGYEKGYRKKLEAMAAKRKKCRGEGMPEWLLSNCDEIKQRAETAKQTQNPSAESTDTFAKPQSPPPEEQKTNFDILSMHSFDVFSDYNMRPIDNLHLTAPRRRLDSTQLFTELEGGEDEFDNESPIKVELNETLTDSNSITFLTSKTDCWLLLGSVFRISAAQRKILESKMPRSFFWLLETCAQTIGVDWLVLYEQLLTIETMFLYGIETLDNFENCVRFKYNNPVKDYNVLINSYREIW